MNRYNYRVEGDIIKMDVHDVFILPELGRININNYGYACAKVRSWVDSPLKGKKVYLHRYIMGNPDCIIDHIDRDKLNNCRCNLRETTNIVNATNKGLPINNVSGFKGVGYNRDRGKWYSRITYNKKRIHLGYYDDFIQACRARTIAEVVYFDTYSVQRIPVVYKE